MSFIETNECLGTHPTIQVDGYTIPGKLRVGPFGLINGIMGAREDGWGYLGYEVNEQLELTRFIRIRESTNARTRELQRDPSETEDSR